MAGIAASALGAGLSRSAGAQDEAASASRLLLPDSDDSLVGPRMNMARAYQVLEQLELDALVLGEGINLYHASGLWPVTTRMGHPPSTFAIVTRDKDRPLSLVVSSFTYYFQLADVHSSDNFPVYLYTAPAGPVDESTGEPDAAPVTVFDDRQEVPMDVIESRRASLAFAAEKERGASAGAQYAMRKALKAAGIGKARIAIDHPAGRRLVESAAPAATLVDADDVLRRIRPYKSDLEIQLMRHAASANAEAALAAVRAVRAGATYHDLRSVFWSEAARRGNRGVFMVIDRVSADTYNAPIRDGQALLIDAVSEYQGYHGDYGRTIFVGEPSAAMARATTAIGTAWSEVQNAMKPGMRFSEISALGQQTLKKLGADYVVPFTPHSVGLYHTDHVGTANPAAFREDPVLEKGMILSVDCPLLAAGMGGSAHLEDLTLITETGSESINDSGDQTIVI